MLKTITQKSKPTDNRETERQRDRETENDI